MRRSRRGARKAPGFAAQDEHEAIALRIHQIAAVAGVMAQAQPEPLSHALYLIEEILLEVEDRVQRLSGARPLPKTLRASFKARRASS